MWPIVRGRGTLAAGRDVETLPELPAAFPSPPLPSLPSLPSQDNFLLQLRHEKVAAVVGGLWEDRPEWLRPPPSQKYAFVPLAVVGLTRLK